MSTTILTANVRCRRDVVLARDRARQAAALLGFDALEQACIAAAVFEIASQAREASRPMLHFQVEGELFQVFAMPQQASSEAPAGLRLEKPMPKKEPAIALEDVPWAIRQLAEQTPPSLFNEIKRQNQELLYALAELNGCRAKVASLAPENARPAA